MVAAVGILPMRAERITAEDIRPDRELLITAPAVLDSEATRYPGPWSFGGLVEQIAGPNGMPSSLVRKWLETWTLAQTVNEQLVGPRPGIVEKVIRPWQKRDGYDPASGGLWEPKLANAPFRLLAIVNRMDLSAARIAGTRSEVQNLWRLNGREDEFLKLEGQATFGLSAGSSGYYGGDNITAGEGRFVFGAVDDAGKPLPGAWTVIFEYNLPIDEKRTVRQWAQSWHELGELDLNTTHYAERLEQVTRLFTHMVDPQQRTVPLAQLRTSEAAFGPGREFRQFNAQFTPVPLTLTPAQWYANRHSQEHRQLLEFLHVQDGLIRTGVHQLPMNLAINGERHALLAGSAFIPANEPDFHWDRGPRVSREARRIFSLSTCNGCHAGETGCREGLHIHPREAGSTARLSEFLRTDGKPHRLNDPDVRGSKVEYQEMQNRAAIFAALLEPSDRAVVDALRPVLRERLNRTH